MFFRLFARLSLLALIGAALVAQNQAQAPAAGPASPASTPNFTIADVHASPEVNFPFVNGGNLHGDRYTLRQATMVDLISNAYGLDASMVQGGPSWLELDRFDVIAQAPAGTPAPTLKLMLRSLLAERFKLVVHNGNAPLPAYVLTAVKPKMTPSADNSGNSECVPQPQPANQPDNAIRTLVVDCKNMSMEKFAPILQDFAGGYFDNKPLVDSTSLKGNFDFEFKWTPRGQLARAGSDGISIFDAMDKQLGLKLELQTAPRPVLLVDSVSETPTPNVAGIEKILPPLPPAQFEVAVIKPGKPDAPTQGGIHGDRVDVQSIPLRFLIQIAWNLNFGDKEVLVGLPDWASKDRYDIQAKASAEDLSEAASGNAQIEFEEVRQMLQALLIDRFGIQAHMENRPVTAYNFEAAGPKLKPASDPNERTKCDEGPGPGEKDPRATTPIINRVLHCQNMTLAEFGRQLPFLAAGYIYSPVVDDSGLQGRYDFTLSFSSIGRVQSGAGAGDGGGGSTPAGASLAAADPNGAISLFDAVHRELGLKLDKVQRPVPVLVIDHINEQPTAN